MAESAQRGGNQAEAELYANKIIELDPRNADAWRIKGPAAGWQSTLARPRIQESIECWGRAVAYVDEEKKDAWREDFARQFTALYKALWTQVAKLFAGNPSDANLNDMKSRQDLISRDILLLNAKLASPRFTYDTDELYNHVARSINDAAMTASRNADAAYGPENSDRNRFAYRSWMDKTDRCIDALGLALKTAASESLLETIYSNIVKLENAVINSKSYKFDATVGYVVDAALSKEAVDLRHRMMDTYRKLKDTHIEKVRLLVKAKVAIAEEKQAERNRKYWEEHAEEKAALETKRDALQKRYEEAEGPRKYAQAKLDAAQRRLKDPVPAEKEEEAILERIRDISARLSKLGLFKGKEKKALQEQFRAQEEQLVEVRARIKEEKAARVEELTPQIDRLKEELAPLQQRSNELKAELDAVEEELSKPR